jgi:hypothetical protein
VRPDPFDDLDDDPDDPDAPVRPEPLGAPPYDPAGPTRLAIGPDGLDTDANGFADSAVVADGPDLMLHTDFDGDGLADQVLRLGPSTLPPHPDGRRAGSDTGERPEEVHWWAPWTWFGDP